MGTMGTTGTMTIDCDECTMRATDACADCVVSFVMGRSPGDALVIEVAEARAVRMLARAGLVPELRHTIDEPDAVQPGMASPSPLAARR